MHEILSIFTVFDQESSRPVRFAMVYIRLVFEMAIEGLFQENLSIAQLIMVAILLGQVSNIVLRGVKGCLEAKQMLKIVGFICVFLCIVLSWYIVLVQIAGMERPEVTPPLSLL